MNDYIQEFNRRLIWVFENKAQEFTQYSHEDISTAAVAAQIAGLYTDLVEIMKT